MGLWFRLPPANSLAAAVRRAQSDSEAHVIRTVQSWLRDICYDQTATGCLVSSAYVSTQHPWVAYVNEMAALRPCRLGTIDRM